MYCGFIRLYSGRLDRKKTLYDDRESSERYRTERTLQKKRRYTGVIAGVNTGVKKERYILLDIMRGCCLISMILFHATWDCVYLFGVNAPWFGETPGYIWQQSICWGFILLAGFCIPFGRKPIRHGITVFVCGAVLTAVTCFFLPDSRVIFGVLTLLGSCMLLTALLDKYLRKIPAVWGISGCVLLFLVFRDINEGFLGFEGLRVASVPDFFYRNYITTFLGFPMAGFTSVDYFSLFPWLFLFLTGYFAHFAVMKGKGEMWLKKGGGRVLPWLGRHSLLVYMAHQPVIYVILTVFFHFCSA